MSWTLLRLALTNASFLFVMPVPVARPQSTGPPSAGAVGSDPQPADFQFAQVVVVGDRASLAAALKNKRDAAGIVDSVIGDDIARLPDLNVTEALQRITGIQIQRDLGEGSSPSIRGLTQMETLLNGREVFTASAGRNLNFEDMPSELISGIDVYKTSSADQLEGGVGGTIDLRTHRPFDFAEREIVGSARLAHGGLVGRNEPQFALLASDRWRTMSAGEMGALVNVSYQERAFREDQKSSGNGGDLTAARVDADYGILASFFQTLSAGVRFAKRGATNAPGLIFADAPVKGLTGADRPTFLTPNPYHLFPGEGSASVGNYLVGNLNSARDPAALRAAFDIFAPIPTSANPASLWRITENARAAYVMAEFAAPNLPIDGNIGLRLINTRESVSGSQSGPAAGEIRPIAVDSSYVNWLPSVNLRYRPGHDLQFRAAASKTITRPDFNQLSPSLTLIPNSISPSLNQGSAGNPDLKPVRADNLDVSVEQYLGRTTAITITAFRKHVDGFITTVSNSEVHDGGTYEVARPQNGTGAHIQGLELAYQQFYDFLPGKWAGLGLQVNYTYVDSESPSSALGVVAPLQNLSRNGINLIGMYERGGVSARVAYNWRDKFLSGVSNIVGIGALPIYTEAYGWFDASLRYRFTEQVSLAFEGINLLGTMRRSYYGVATRPQSAWLDDTQLAVTVTIRI